MIDRKTLSRWERVYFADPMWAQFVPFNSANDKTTCSIATAAC